MARARLPKDDPYAAMVLDWCVLNGFDSFEMEEEQPDPWMTQDAGNRFTFIGEATCTFVEHPTVIVDDENNYQLDHLIDVATMTALGCPLPLELMEGLIASLQNRLTEIDDGCTFEIEAYEHDHRRFIWVVSRLNEAEFDAQLLDAKMRAHFALVQEVEEIVL